MRNMRHVEKALVKFGPTDYIRIENAEDTKGVPPVVSFTIQSDPVKEVGVNGLQALDMLVYVKCLFDSLNEAFPCNENEDTVDCLEMAIFWQHKRTEDRIKRGVEGRNAH